MAFAYSTYYTLRNTRAADTTVLGLDWEAGEGGEGGAGKPIVCVLYALVIFVSCLWMPATLKALRGEGSVTYVIAILNVVVSVSQSLSRGETPTTEPTRHAPYTYQRPASPTTDLDVSPPDLTFARPPLLPSPLPPPQRTGPNSNGWR